MMNEPAWDHPSIPSMHNNYSNNLPTHTSADGVMMFRVSFHIAVEGATEVETNFLLEWTKYCWINVAALDYATPIDNTQFI